MSDTLSAELRKNYETDENEAATLPEGVSRTEEADIITLDSDATTPRYGMPCGHAIGIESLKTYCTSELQKGKTKIQCPACTEEWQCGLIKTVVNLSVNKDKEFDTIFIQGIKDNGRDVQACPKCRTDCVRETTSDSRVRCYTCTSDRVIFEFCWYCRGTWMIPENSDCGNEGCSGEDQRLTILRTCPNKVIDYNKVTSPSIRACPSCSILLEHIGGCNNMCCSKCNHGFCFICLKQRDSRGNLPCGSQSTVCQPAPVQEHLFK